VEIILEVNRNQDASFSTANLAKIHGAICEISHNTSTHNRMNRLTNL